MRTHYHAFVALAIAAISLSTSYQAHSEIPQAIRKVVRTRDEFQNAVTQATPGTTILIAPGTYRGGLRFANIQGTKQAPITIAALDEKQPPRFEGGTSGLHFTAPRHLQLRSLVLTGATGNGINIDDGGNAALPAEHIVLQRLQVRDIGNRGNHDGIKLSGVDHFRVEDCTIERWGASGSAIDMVGCHHGSVLRSTFRYRSNIFGNAIQTKGGSSEINIARCRFENAGGRAVNIGGSTGRDYFRPRDARYEAKNITVEDCTFIGSMSPIAFVGVDGAVVRYNTIYRPTRWVARILQESKGSEFVPCRNGRFTNNLIAFRSDEVRSTVNVGGETAALTFTFAQNHWFCINNPPRSNQLALPVPETNASYGRNPEFVDERHLDLRLGTTSPVRHAGVRRPD